MERVKETGAVITALVAMSGTSLDGVDAAVLQTDGVAVHGFGAHGYREYAADDRAELRAALGCWTAPNLEPATDGVMAAQEALLSTFDDVDLVGFHGQTVAHAPRMQGTLQLGDGAALARALDWPVVWDFRSADVELGGEGAPLAPFFHFACA